MMMPGYIAGARPLRPHAATRPMQRRPLPQRWCEELVLDDGRRLVVRPIDPLDAEPLRRGFHLLTPEEIRLRFLHPMKEMSVEMAQRLTRLDPAREFALVAAEPLPPGQALVGAVVRAYVCPGERRAEFAILVSRFLAGRGLGRHLMRRVIRWAWLKRLDEIYGDVLDENTAMLDLAAELGFSREPLASDPGVIRVRLRLRERD